MPLYEKNIIFTDTILDYVEDLEALRGMLTNRIEHEKKYGTGLNGISPPVKRHPNSIECYPTRG